MALPLDDLDGLVARQVDHGAVRDAEVGRPLLQPRNAAHAVHLRTGQTMRKEGRKEGRKDYGLASVFHTTQLG